MLNLALTIALVAATQDASQPRATPAEPTTATKPARAASTQEERSVVVMDIAGARGLDKQLQVLLNEQLLTLVSQSGAFDRVVGAGDVRDLLDLEQQKAAFDGDCDDTSCMAELGGALGVRQMINVSLGKVGGAFLITFKRMDVDESEVLHRDSAKAGSEGELLDALDALVTGALGVPKTGTAPPARQGLSPLRLGAFGLVAGGLSAGAYNLLRPDAGTQKNVPLALSADLLVVGGLALILLGGR